MITSKERAKPFVAEAILQHQLSGKRLELEVSFNGDEPYRIVVSQNSCYVYDFAGNLLETICA